MVGDVPNLPLLHDAIQQRAWFFLQCGWQGHLPSIPYLARMALDVLGNAIPVKERFHGLQARQVNAANCFSSGLRAACAAAMSMICNATQSIHGLIDCTSRHQGAMQLNAAKCN
eukprot:s494_g18.t1